MTIQLPNFTVPYIVETKHGRLVIRLCDERGTTNAPWGHLTPTVFAYGARFSGRPECLTLLTKISSTQEEFERAHQTGLNLREDLKNSPRGAEIMSALLSIPGVVAV